MSFALGYFNLARLRLRAFLDGNGQDAGIAFCAQRGNIRHFREIDAHRVISTLEFGSDELEACRVLVFRSRLERERAPFDVEFDFFLGNAWESDLEFVVLGAFRECRRRSCIGFFVPF